MTRAAYNVQKKNYKNWKNFSKNKKQLLLKKGQTVFFLNVIGTKKMTEIVLQKKK